MQRYLILLIILLSACQGKKQESEQIRLLSKTEVIDRARAHDLDYSYAVFNGANGLMSPEEHSLLNKGKLARDFYQNNVGEITEVRVRPIELADKFVEIQIRVAATNPLSQVVPIEMDCNDLGAIFQEVWDSDQEVRTGGGNMNLTDSLNRQKVISSIFNCGWSEEHLQTIWLVFQHSPEGIMAYFYPELKKYAEEGKLSKSSIALMEDRLLMRNGYKQVYGSQISGGELYELEEPDSVDIRRATMDLGPIEDYLQHFDLDWEKELARLKKMEED